MSPIVMISPFMAVRMISNAAVFPEPGIPTTPTTVMCSCMMRCNPAGLINVQSINVLSYMVIIRGLEESEFLSKLYPLLERCFEGSKEDKRFYNLHHERPYNAPAWDYSRIALVDGQLVSHVGIWSFTMSVPGGFKMPSGGIRDVCTDPAFRRRGLGHLLLEDALSFMRSKDMAFSVLYAGPRQFYRQKGWEVAIPGYRFTLDASRITCKGEGDHAFTINETTSEQLVHGIFRMRKATNAFLWFVVERDIGYLERMIDISLQDPNQHVVSCSDSTGHLEGYALLKVNPRNERSSVQILEARFTTGSATRSKGIIDAFLAFIKDRFDPGSISVQLSPNHDITRRMMGLGALDRSSLLTGCMVQVVSTRVFLEVLLGGINHMLRAQPASIPSTSISCRFIVRIGTKINSTPERRPCRIFFNLDPSDGIPRFELAGGNECKEESHVPEVSMSRETFLSVLFSPILTVGDALDEGLIQAPRSLHAVIKLMLDHASWDLEPRDYF
ncbi:GNAT family N-acetyltransferase [Candidatus Bathyarchaeota archaeon]|nr:GNAT family N-acetyltransferase [Candidatus Bathyarchaeota archaeon]